MNLPAVAVPGPPTAAQTLPKRTPIEEFALRTSRMRAWRSFLNRETHPYRGFRPSDVQNASGVLIFASPTAPLSQISLFGHLKCERGAHFCIAKRTPIADSAEFTMVYALEGLMYIYTYIHTYIYAHLRAMKHTRATMRTIPRS